MALLLFPGVVETEVLGDRLLSQLIRRAIALGWLKGANRRFSAGEAAPTPPLVRSSSLLVVNGFLFSFVVEASHPCGQDAPVCASKLALDCGRRYDDVIPDTEISFYHRAPQL